MIDLDNLERLEREATPGEWSVYDDGSGFMDVLAGGKVIAAMGCIGPNAPDPHLIASARNALPALLAVARAAVAWEEARAHIESLPHGGEADAPAMTNQRLQLHKRKRALEHGITAAVRALKEAP